MMGAEAIKELLKRVDIDELSGELRNEDEERELAAEEDQIREAFEGCRGLREIAATSRNG